MQRFQAHKIDCKIIFNQSQVFVARRLVTFVATYPSNRSQKNPQKTKTKPTTTKTTKKKTSETKSPKRILSSAGMCKWSSANASTIPSTDYKYLLLLLSLYVVVHKRRGSSWTSIWWHISATTYQIIISTFQTSNWRADLTIRGINKPQ